MFAIEKTTRVCHLKVNRLVVQLSNIVYLKIVLVKKKLVIGVNLSLLKKGNHTCYQ
jgi:hypothetical protein